MKIKYFSLLLAAILLLSLPNAAAAANNTDAAIAAPISQNLIINDRFYYVEGYIINGNNYFKLRDIADCFCGSSSQFDVVWNAEKNAVEIHKGEPYSGEFTGYEHAKNSVTAYKTDASLLIDGEKANITAYNINNSNYYMLRDFADILNLEIIWNDENKQIYIYINNDSAKALERTGTDTSHEYLIDERWASTVKSALNDNGDGTISAVSVDNSVHIDTYDADTKQLLYSNEVTMELDIFGGIYFGSEYNFIVFGQSNTEESDSKVTFKTVKYSKDWKLIDSADYKNNNTVEPFACGSLRMAEYDGYLYIRTSHKMYAFINGLNHQSNITYSVKIDTMDIADSYSTISNISNGYCSHSFDQYITVDNGKLICLDLGDAGPRGVIIGHYENSSNTSLESGKFIANGSYRYVNLLNIPGGGVNCTGVSIGGLAVGSKNYITAISKIDFSKATSFDSFTISGADTDQRDVVLLISAKDNSDTTNVKQVQLTDYSGNNMTCSSPYIVTLNNKYAVIWNEYDLSNNSSCVKYVLTDEDGKKLSDIKNFDGELGCQPIYTGGKILWCVNKQSARYFYSIEP